MAYNPELVKQLLGEKLSELFDGTVEVISHENKLFANLKVGDTLVFNLKPNPNFQPRQFIVTEGK